MMGCKNPLETYLFMGDSNNYKTRRAIIGVFEDFHIRSLYEKVQPMLIYLVPRSAQQMAIRLSPDDVKTTMNSMEKIMGICFSRRIRSSMFLWMRHCV